MSRIVEPICLTIAGLDPSGGAGIIADIKTFAAFGCFATAAVTSITFQNTMGVFGVSHQTAEAVRNQLEPILDDYDVAAVKTGMLPTSEIVDTVADIISERGLKNIVVDPVIRSTSGVRLIDYDALFALTERLFPLADVVTPNVPEAEIIAKINLATHTEYERAAKIMLSMEAKSVLIKGGHATHFDSGDRTVTDQLFTPGRTRFDAPHRTLFTAPYIETAATHGTGCTLASAIAANLAVGKGVAEAVKIAKDFVREAIRTAPHIGKGNSPINI